MTTIYNDYYEAYDNKTMDLSNVSFLVMLVDDTYTPNPSDKLDDVTGVIISVPYVITNDDIVKLNMAVIIDKTKLLLKEYIELYPKQVINHKSFEDGRYIIVFNPSLNILCFCEKINEEIWRDIG